MGSATCRDDDLDRDRRRTHGGGRAGDHRAICAVVDEVSKGRRESERIVAVGVDEAIEIASCVADKGVGFEA